MSNFDVSPASTVEVPLWLRWLYVALSNAFATFLLCVLLLRMTGPAGGVLFLFGFVAAPGLTAALVVRSSARDRSAPLGAAASAAYFILLFAFGVVIELATAWGLLQAFWRGPQWGA